LYASAKVVLNDHWPDMARMGFVSNRIFDVLGAGGVVVSDPVPGMEELFGDLVPTYSSAAELDDLVTSLLADEPRRREIGRRGAALVADHHTMDQRADVLATWLRDGIARRAAGVRTPPSPT
jgi:spore maturation protein CgeB